MDMTWRETQTGFDAITEFSWEGNPGIMWLMSDVGSTWTRSGQDKKAESILREVVC
jgi:photosystem II stability/assembly factor-like uncharacterized protein